MAVFLGQYEVSVDALGRFELPAPFAERLAAGAFVTRGFDGDLIVIPAGAFSAWVAQISAFSKTDPLARLLARLVMSHAAPVNPDDRGNVTLPQALRALSRIEGRAVVVGGGDLLEIWAPEPWARQQTVLQNIPANADRFSSLNLIVTA